MVRYIKSIFAGTLITIILGAIGYIYWQEEAKFYLPTPMPKEYKPIKIDQAVNPLEITGNFITNNSNSQFLHFFNVDCPCSRFNMQEFENLVNKYNEQIDFCIVLQTKNPDDKKILSSK